jgi:hypothetical protein
MKVTPTIVTGLSTAACFAATLALGRAGRLSGMRGART